MSQISSNNLETILISNIVINRRSDFAMQRSSTRKPRETQSFLSHQDSGSKMITQQQQQI